MERDTEFLTYLEVQIKFADDLGSRWAVNGYGVDWEVGSVEGPFRGRLGCDHGEKGDVPRNDPADLMRHPVMTAFTSCRS